MSRDVTECRQKCKSENKFCRETECRYWIKYKEDLNCALIAVEKNGKMTLRETADRLHISFVRVKQIQDKAAKKLLKCLDISALED